MLRVGTQRYQQGLPRGAWEPVRPIQTTSSSSFPRSAWGCNGTSKGCHAERGSQMKAGFFSFPCSAWERNGTSKGCHAERGSRLDLFRPPALIHRQQPFAIGVVSGTGIAPVFGVINISPLDRILMNIFDLLLHQLRTADPFRMNTFLPELPLTVGFMGQFELLKLVQQGRGFSLL